MRQGMVLVIVLVVFLGGVAVAGVGTGGGEVAGGKDSVVSFAKEVFPIIRKNCLPCHAEDQFNPSELSLDAYDLLMAGGKHGAAVVPGSPKESLLVKKLMANPPFGDRMPLDSKKKKGEPSKKALSEDDIKTIVEWIKGGAKNN